MHALSFAFKRAHLRATAMGRLLLRPFGLTPARFDLLFLLQRSTSRRNQVTLASELGLSRATVCRCVRRLEELGFIRRIRISLNRRTHLLELTDFGRSVVRRAIRHILGGGYLELAYQCVYFGPSERAFFLVEDVLSYVNMAAKSFGDTSTLYYPTGHPDD